ncbi:hypothetical protein [Deinococcus sp.]|uniref:hypothetical protein n=1 Tax=Deinococcus sp. TaxID=47478 RepID=UPI0025C173A1|nr:hypothetical protein [Deinococcus sp.]
MTLDSEDNFVFVPPLARVIPVCEAVIYPLDRVAFLQAAEAIIPLLKHPVTGQAWEYDGYRRTQLFLVQPHHEALGLPEYTVEFELQFSGEQTTVSIRNLSPSVKHLFHQFTHELALMLLRSRTQHY